MDRPELPAEWQWFRTRKGSHYCRRGCDPNLVGAWHPTRGWRTLVGLSSAEGPPWSAAEAAREQRRIDDARDREAAAAAPPISSTYDPRRMARGWADRQAAVERAAIDPSKDGGHSD